MCGLEDLTSAGQALRFASNDHLLQLFLRFVAKRAFSVAGTVFCNAGSILAIGNLAQMKGFEIFLTDSGVDPGGPGPRYFAKGAMHQSGTSDN